MNARRFFLILYLIYNIINVQGQQTNEYIFYLFGTEAYHITLDIHDSSDNYITQIIGNKESARKFQYPFQTYFKLHYHGGTLDGQVKTRAIDRNETVYPTQYYVGLYWSPVIENMSAVAYGNPNSQSIVITNSGISNNAKEIFSDRIFNLSATCEYNGVKWSIITTEDTIYDVATGKNVSISCKKIISLMNNNYLKSFQIVPYVPYYYPDKNVQPVPVGSTIRFSVYRTETLKIKPHNINTSDADSCNGKIRLMLSTSMHGTRVNLQAGYNNNFKNITRFFNKELTGYYYTYFDVQYSDVENLFPGENTFQFRAVFQDSVDIVQSLLPNPVTLFPPLSDFSVSVQDYCEGNPGMGGITITRQDASYDELFQIMDSLGRPINIKSFIISKGQYQYNKDSIMEGTYMLNSVRNDSTGISCPSKTVKFTIKRRRNPSIISTIPHTITCPGNKDGKIRGEYYNPNKSNSLEVYLISPFTSRFSIFNTSEYGTYETGYILDTGIYKFYIADNYGCKSDVKETRLVPVDSLRFDLIGIPPSCNGSSDGKIYITNINGGADHIYYYMVTLNIFEDGVSRFSNIVSISPDDTFLVNNHYSGTNTYAINIEIREELYPGHCNSSPREILLKEPPKLQFKTDTPYITSYYSGYSLKCNGDNTGKIELFSKGGTPPVKYILTDPLNGTQFNNTGVFNNLTAGSYRASLSDSHGCNTDSFLTIQLTQPPPISVQHISTPEKCHNTADGSITVNVISPKPVTRYQWLQGQKIIDTTINLINKPSGIYTLNITDIENCVTSVNNLVIPAAAEINFTTTTVSPSCIGYNDGAINLTGISNGKAPYRFVFNQTDSGAVGSLPRSFNNLKAGNYLLEIRDANFQAEGIYSNCKTLKTVRLEDKAKASLDYTINEPRCFGESTGSVVVNSISGPDNPFLYAWVNELNDTVGRGNQLTNVESGYYTAVIKDNRNCVEKHSGIMVTSPPELRINSVITEMSSCKEVADGRITINASGGTGTIRYSIDAGQTFSPMNIFTDKPFGIYSLRLADSRNCYADTTTEIKAGKLTLNLLARQNATCYGYTNGLIQTSAAGSKLNEYEFHLQSEKFSRLNSIGLFTNIPAARYDLWARDAAGCNTDTLTVLISQPDSIAVKLTLLDSAACNKPLGKIGYNVTGGNGSYKYIWSKTGFGVITNFNPMMLKAGNYILKIRDTLGCEASGDIFVPDRPAPQITGFDLLKQPWCDMPSGTVKVNIAAGTPPFRYQWSSSSKDTLSTVGNLKEGTYHVVVTDRYQCMTEADYTLNDGPDLELFSDVTNAHCGQHDGSVVLSVAGGIAPYLFRWPDSVSRLPVSSPIMNNLYSGVYNVSVIDSIGCEKPFYVIVNDINGPVIDRLNFTKSWCGMPTGTSVINVSGGKPPYLYYYSGTNFGQSSANGSIQGLRAGKYFVKVTDADNCKIAAGFEITDSVELQPVLSLKYLDSSACNKPLGKISVDINNGLPPYRFLWNTGDTTRSLIGLIKGTYKVTAIDRRGCRDSLSIVLPDRKPPQLLLLSTENAYCSMQYGKATVGAYPGTPPLTAYIIDDKRYVTPLDYSAYLGMYTGTVDSLPPSDKPYVLQVTDSNGCTSNEVMPLIEDNNPLVLQLVDVKPVSCYNGSDGYAVVSVSNGIEPYSFKWTPVTSDTSINKHLPAGPFSVTVTDAMSCTKTLNITATPVTQPAPVNIIASFKTDPSCHDFCDGSLSAIASGGNGGYIYIWNNNDTAQTVDNLCAGNHYLQVIDSKGCRYDGTFVLNNPAIISETELPSEMTICSGQIYKAYPGNAFTDIHWHSGNGFSSDQPVAELSVPDIYYMSAVSQQGCPVSDTLHLFVSDNLLNAEFLMISQAYSTDTIIIIEVSWPLAETCSWKLPDEAKIVTDEGYYKELVFNNSGNYYVELFATLAGCSSVKGKYIDILEPDIDVSHKEKSALNESLIKHFEIYPNPASEVFYSEIKLATEAKVILEIISVSGNTVMYSVQREGLAEYVIPVDISSLVRGVYMVKLNAAGEIKTKILILR